MRRIQVGLGHLIFVVGVGALAAAGSLLGSEHPLGIFATGLAAPIWSCQYVVRRGLRMLGLACVFVSLVIVDLWIVLGIDLWGSLVLVLGSALALAGLHRLHRRSMELSGTFDRPEVRH